MIEATPHTRTEGEGVIEQSRHTVSHGGMASIKQCPDTFTGGTEIIEPSVKEG